VVLNANKFLLMVGKMKQNKGLEQQKNSRAYVVAFLCQVSEVVA